LSQNLQAGNLSAAQTDYSNIQQDLQQKAAQGAQGHHHHHHSMPTESSQNPPTSDPGSAIDQAFGLLGQDLQTGNLQAAQQAYATLQQDFQQFAALGPAAGGSSSGSSSSALSGINITI